MRRSAIPSQNLPDKSLSLTTSVNYLDARSEEGPNDVDLATSYYASYCCALHESFQSASFTTDLVLVHGTGRDF